MLSAHTRLQRVGVAAGAQPQHGGVDQRGGVGAGQCRVGPHVGGQLQGAWVVARGKFSEGTQCGRHLQGAVAEFGVAGGLEAHQLAEGPVADPLQVRGHAQAPPRQLGRLGGGVHDQSPGQLVRLLGELVAHGFTADLQISLRLDAPHAFGWGGEGLPLASVETAQHRSPEVQLLPGRHHVGLEPHAQRNPFVQRQLRHITYLHGGRQPGAPGGRIRRCAPQRRQPREEDEQRGHDGCAQQHHAACRARGFAQRWFAHRLVGIHQRGEQAQQPDHHGSSRQQRLRKEEVREHREEAQEEDDESIAPRPQLQRLERQQQGGEGDAGVPPQHGLVGQQGAGDDGQQHAQQPPAPGQGPCMPGQPAAPQQRARSQRRGPQRQHVQLRQHHPAHHQQQEEGVAAFAGQGVHLLAHAGGPGRGRRRRVRGGHHRASASRQRCWWAVPWPGATGGMPGRRRP